MPYSCKVETKYVMVKYESSDTGYELNYEDVENCTKIELRADSTREFVKACLFAGFPVAVIGITKFLIQQQIHTHVYPIVPKCVIFEVPVPAEHEEEFDRFVANELADQLRDMFRNVEDHLRKEIGDDLDRVDSDILEKLKTTKVSEVTICDSETVQKAKAAAVKSAATKEQPASPKNVRVKENPQSPSTSFLVFYERPEQGIKDSYSYVVTAQSLDSNAQQKPVEVETNEEYVILKKLLPGQSYLVWVQSQKNGMRSSKALLSDPLRTAQYDPYPWRSWDTSSTAGDSAYGLSIAETEVGSRDIPTASPPAESDDQGDPGLWKSDLHMELQKILRVRFPDSKMKRLLFKCDELGIVEAKDLKYLESKEITDLLKETIKPVEILKLMDYAKDQYSGSFHRSSGTSGETPKIMMNLGDLHMHRSTFDISSRS